MQDMMTQQPWKRVGGPQRKSVYAEITGNVAQQQGELETEDPKDLKCLFTLPMRSGCTFTSSYYQPPVSLSFSKCVSASCSRKSLAKHMSVPKGTAFYI